MHLWLKGPQRAESLLELDCPFDSLCRILEDNTFRETTVVQTALLHKNKKQMCGQSPNVNISFLCKPSALSIVRNGSKAGT